MKKKKLEIGETKLYIRDDLGHAWYFDGEKIRLVLADLEAQDAEELEENGYYCDSLVHGIQMLNDMGYISGVEYDDSYASDYFSNKSHAEGW